MSNSKSARIIDGPETQPSGIYGNWPLWKFFLVEPHVNYITIQRQNLDYCKFTFRNDGTKISGCESGPNGPSEIPPNRRAQELDHDASLTAILGVLATVLARSVCSKKPVWSKKADTGKLHGGHWSYRRGPVEVSFTFRQAIPHYAAAGEGWSSSSVRGTRGKAGAAPGSSAAMRLVEFFDSARALDSVPVPSERRCKRSTNGA